MLYIARILVTILAVFLAVAHDEQKHTSYTLRNRVWKLENENAKLRAETMTDEAWNAMVEQALANIH